jgi:hypothetical protein
MTGFLIGSTVLLIHVDNHIRHLPDEGGGQGGGPCFAGD